ncbi:MAG TPA: hypothetical protein VL595_05660 [Pseudonocardia sp.]|nr:hypothetical protein [Pseudonocardia sp.]
MVNEIDERLHTPGTVMPARWQENMMALGWDLEQNIGFWWHAQRVPHTRFTEIKAGVFEVASGVSGREVVPMPESVMFEGLVIEEPFKKVRLSYHGRGVRHTDDKHLPCLSATGDVPYGMDLTLHGLAGPIDWHEPLSSMGAVENDHYEMAGSWEGTLAFPDRTVRASGLYLRDHTWGLRNYTPERRTDESEHGHGGFDLAWFTPLVLDEGRTFVNGLVVKAGRDDPAGRAQTFCTLTEGETTSLYDRFDVEVTRGTEEVARYDAARITGGDANTDIDCRLEVIRHLPMYLPDHGGPFVQSDAYGTVTWGSRTGWGSAQLSETDGKWQQRPEFADQIAAL